MRDALLYWARGVGKRIGVVVIVRTAKNTGRPRSRTFVILGC